MASGIKTKFEFSSDLSVVDFTKTLFADFEEMCKDTRMEIVNRKPNVLGFKGPLFRFSASQFHYMNGVSCGRLEIIEYEDGSFTLERTFCYKEFVLIALPFTMLAIWMFFSPLYSYHFESGFVLSNVMLGSIALFVIWGVFFTGNIILTSMRFSQFVRKTKQKVIEEYIVANS